MNQTTFKRIRTQPGDRLDVLAHTTGVSIPEILRANPDVFDPLAMPPIVLPSGVSLIIPNPSPQTPAQSSQSRKLTPPWR